MYQSDGSAFILLVGYGEISGCPALATQVCISCRYDKSECHSGLFYSSCENNVPVQSAALNILKNIPPERAIMLLKAKRAKEPACS